MVVPRQRQLQQQGGQARRRRRQDEQRRRLLLLVAVVVLAKWGREGVSPRESRRVSLPLSAKLLETREPASCCRMGRPPALSHPTPCRLGPRRRRSHLLHYRVVLNWTAPCAARFARSPAPPAARQEGGAGQSPPFPRGQQGRGRAGAAFPLFTPLPDPEMSSLLGSRSLEEGVARDSSAPSPFPSPSLSLSHSLPFPSPSVFLPAQPPSHSISTCPELQIQPSHHNQTGTKLQPAVSLPGSPENITWTGNYKHGLYVFFKSSFALCCLGDLFYFVGTLAVLLLVVSLCLCLFLANRVCVYVCLCSFP